MALRGEVGAILKNGVSVALSVAAGSIIERR
jgi:hypothetical protein